MATGHAAWLPQGCYPTVAYGYGWYAPYPYYVHPTPQALVYTSPPLSKSPRSIFPNVNKYLAVDTTLLKYDVRRPPDKAIDTSYYYRLSQRSAGGRKNLTTLHLISKDFPWRFTIYGSETKPITCADVWKSLHDGLNQDIEDAEWAIVCSFDDQRRGEIMEAAKGRCGGSELQLKRIDWLGDRIAFVGVEVDTDFAQSRCLPGGDDGQETWLVRFSPL
ncbi:hypothetical protein NEOLEDRAFT_759252 [Neolentinus lepideus HHB14362 ss-1]|uniref:DUF6699 domain-containing protein n=1 Tax=Neolentinus lepideus HHB14362 ss-1 TaxID=1314782 RepID=A0A165PSJ0_9AGAM|nr:hypothetical protein NEOLEDRAFT_759252 [Neolentinus lepideus HHB14362 ss-1]